LASQTETGASLRSIIVEHLIAERQSGLCLPYDDYKLINLWIETAGENVDQLILVVGDEVAHQFENHQRRGGKYAPSARRIHRRVMQKLTGKQQVSARRA
jgi:hypothetical protein